MNKSKKKFNETKVGKFLLEKAPKIFTSVAGDTLPGKVIEALIGGSDLPAEDKEVALAKLEIERSEIDGVTRRWMADSRSGMLAQNVRPITLIVLTCAFICGWMLQLAELEIVADLLKVVFFAYFGSRGAEKIFQK